MYCWWSGTAAPDEASPRASGRARARDPVGCKTIGSSLARDGGLDQGYSFCTSRDGTRIAWSRQGAGPALLYLPTWPVHQVFDDSSPIGRPWALLLSRSRMLLRLDLRGSGLSDREPARIGFEAWLEDIEAVVEAAGLQRFALLGHSQGAALAAAYAARHPHRVSHLVACGATSRGRALRAQSAADRKRVEAFRQLVAVGWSSPEPVFRRVFSSLFLQDASAEHLDAWDRMQAQACSTGTALRTIAAIESLDVRQVLPEVRSPTPVLHAAQDARTPAEEGRRFAGLIPGAQFVLLDSRNHVWLPHEACWTAFEQRLQAFLDCAAVDPPSARAPSPADWASALTRRELEVLDLVARGWSNAEIAARLAISPNTLRNHLSHVFGKLQVPSRARAIVLARDAGLGDGPPRA